MVPLFWASVAAIVYVYAGYPVLLAMWARVRPRPVVPGARDKTDPELPGVSIIIAARNEGARLPGRIDNLLQLDYPPDRRQIIVVSDGSTDDTVARLAAYPDVEVVSVPPGGKALALNVGVARARFPLLVFADARQAFVPEALVELAGPFEDPRVGAVTGELLLDTESGRRLSTFDRRNNPDRAVTSTKTATDPATDRRARSDRRRPTSSTIGDGVGLYWRYEKLLRRLESTVSSTLGATGAIYAMRRSLWTALPADTVLDDVLAPMRCVLAGHRVVFSPSARAFDRTSPDAQAESRRKVRTLAGNYQILALEPRLLLPWRNPVWFQYMSHKIGRLLVPYALITCLIASVALSAESPIYAAALGLQCLFYALAAYGAWLARRGGVEVRPPMPTYVRRWPAAPSSGASGGAFNA